MNKAFEKILDRFEEYEYNDLIEHNSEQCEHCKRIDCEIGMDCTICVMNKSKEIVQEVAEEYNGGWIPIKTRPMTEEEKEYYSEYLFEGNGSIYECPLPEDGQEVLVTSKYGSVDKTTFYTDCGNYFENYEDYDDVIAWRPLPEPFKERD